MSPIRIAAFVVAWLGIVTAARAGVIVVDPMTVELTPNSCLPVTMPRVATWGAFCDAPSCPPGTVTPDTDCQCGDQPAFGTELAGSFRTTQVWAWDFSTPVHARLDPVARRMVCVGGGGLASSLDLQYQDADQGLFEADFPAMGVTAIQAVVDGEASPSNPLFLRVTLYTRGAEPGHSSGGHLVGILRAEAPGTYQIPLENFAPDPDDPFPANLRRVNIIWFSLGQCPELACQDSGFPATTFALGPLTLVTGEPTPARRSSWGEVKQAYR